MIKNTITVLIVVVTLLCGTSYAEIAHTKLTANELSINSEEILNVGQDLRGKITHNLQDKKFIQKITKLGIDKNEVEFRLAAMTNSELVQLQNGLERQAGGEVIVISAMTLLIVLVLLMLLR